MERAMGVEPTSKAWEAFILPMNYAREQSYDSRFGGVCQICRIGGSTSNVTDMRAPRKHLVAQVFVCLYAQIPPDFLNALRLNERSPAGRTAHFSRLLH